MQMTSVTNATSRLSVIVPPSVDKDSDPMITTKKLKLLQSRKLNHSDYEDWAWDAWLQGEVHKKEAQCQRWEANSLASRFHVSNLASFARLKRRVEQNLTFLFIIIANKSDSSRGSVVLVQSNAEAE